MTLWTWSTTSRGVNLGIGAWSSAAIGTSLVKRRALKKDGYVLKLLDDAMHSL